jgi:hypothetical protein
LSPVTTISLGSAGGSVGKALRPRQSLPRTSARSNDSPPSVTVRANAIGRTGRSTKKPMTWGKTSPAQLPP